MHHWLHLRELRAFEMPPITGKLQDLRTLDIENYVPDCRDDRAAEYTAQSTFQFLKRIKVSGAVNVKMNLSDHYRGPILDGILHRQWGRPYCQKEFARAGWALIREPESPFPPPAAQRGKYIQWKYVFEAMTPVQE